MLKPLEAGMDAYNHAEFATAVEFWRPLAEQGDVSLQILLGDMFRLGCESGGIHGDVRPDQRVPRDNAEAARWYRMAALQGDASAQRMLGFIYRTGTGVAKDLTEALRWYRMAAYGGDKEAQCLLGDMYRRGTDVVPQDYIQAFDWYRMAANQQDAEVGNGGGWVIEARYYLGRMYAEGKGVAQDYVLAHMWLNLAAAQGIERALSLRESLANVMTPDQLAEALRLARDWKPKPER